MPVASQSAEALVLPQGATASGFVHLSLASGDEVAVRSSALELQEALEAMLVASPKPTVRPTVAIALAVGVAGVIGVCAVFWFSLALTLIAAI